MEFELAALDGLVEHLGLDAVRAVRLVRERAGRGGVRRATPGPADVADRVRQLRPRRRPGPGRGEAVGAGPGPGALGTGFAGAGRHLVPGCAGRGDRDVRPGPAGGGDGGHGGRRCWTCSTGSTSTDLLPLVRVPTLVAHRRGSRAVQFELGRELAALIPGAQLAALDGRLQPIYAEGGRGRGVDAAVVPAGADRYPGAAGRRRPADRARAPGGRPDRGRARPTPRSLGPSACRCGRWTRTSSTSGPNSACGPEPRSRSGRPAPTR